MNIKISENEFIRNNAIFFIGSLSISFVNYLYYPVLGRLLSLESFGELQVLISFFSQITIFITVLTLVSTNVVLNEKNATKANGIVNELEKATLYVAYGLLLLVILISPLLQTVLKFESPLPFIVITLVAIVGISLGFRTAFLRAKGDFVATSIEGLIASFAKIIMSALFVLIGFKTAGAAGGILASQLIALVYATYKARQLGFVKQKQTGKLDWSKLRPQAKFGGLVLFVSLITTMQYSVDVIIIKLLFSPEIAGQYAGIATISRIILFVTGSFAIVLLSSVKIANVPSKNSGLLLRSLGVTVLLGGIVAVAFAVFPTQITHILFGEKYDRFTHILPLLGLAMLLMSLCNLICNYHIALRHYRVMLFVGIGAVTTITLLLFSHQSVEQVVTSLTLGSSVMLLGLLGWTGYRARTVLK